MFENYPDIVNAEQLCEMLQICETTAYRLLKKKAIKSIRIGKNTR